jgi:hypothetical protein
MQAPPTQDQLFKRVMVISLMIGILLGILLTIVGFNLIARYIGALFLVDSLRAGFSDVFYPYLLLIGGATIVLAVKLSAVRGQLHTLVQPAEGSPASLDLVGLILGIYFLILGGILVIERIFSLAIPGLIFVFIFPGGFFFSLLLIPVLEGRRRKRNRR